TSNLLRFQQPAGPAEGARLVHFQQMSGEVWGRGQPHTGDSLTAAKTTKVCEDIFMHSTIYIQYPYCTEMSPKR
ncbi:Vacuolar membrane-associated protein IML1, partial [Dissostichus eleginoides]